jgi:leucyl-tRNA---protein transferase
LLKVKSPTDDQNFLCLEASPEQMDRYWAEGWRHFGIYFFRYRTAAHSDKQFNVLPLRIDLERFELTRSQKRVLAKNHDTQVRLRPAELNDANEELFRKHRVRFRDNVPTSLKEFLSPLPATVPCLNLELCNYIDERLVGVTFLDIGKHSTSAVYAIFDPAEAKRSLGILMMLYSIQFSREHGHRYYYPGYAYREPFSYDYKKNFHGLECLDWESGWRRYGRN